MAHNLFVAYDLMSPGQNYDAVRDRIKSLGQWHQFQYSLFYLHTSYTPAQVYNLVGDVMDSNDRLVVIDACGGVASTWDKPPIPEINAVWGQA